MQRLIAPLILLLSPISAFADTLLAAAVAPPFRAGQVGTTTPVLAAVINAGIETAEDVSIALAPPANIPPIGFSYQTLDSTGTVLTGTPNTPVDIPPGGTQYFLLGLTPTGEINPVNPPELALLFQGTNTPPVPPIRFVNTFIFAAYATNPQELIVSPLTIPSGDGIPLIVNIPFNSGGTTFTLTVKNTGGNLTTELSPDLPLDLPVDLLFCRTNAQGTCLAPLVSLLEVTLKAGEVATFTVFVRQRAWIDFDPAKNRIGIRFLAISPPLQGALVGLTSVAVRNAVVASTPCGDTTGLGGTRVPCSCGDKVTTNTILQKTDPVVSTGPADICGGNGLLVATEVMLDCNKLTLRGVGAGSGLRFVDGDNRAPITVKNCTITRFASGISFGSSDAVNFTVQSNTIIENLGAGIYTDDQGGGRVEKNEIGNNGGCGVVNGDAGGNVYAKNHIFGNWCGISLFDSSDIITGNVIEYNKYEGIVLDEAQRTTVTNNDVRHNGSDGMWVGTASTIFNTIVRNVVSDNGGAGITIQDASANTISSNSGKRNVGNGLEVLVLWENTVNNFVADNEFNRNGKHGICVIPGNIDGGGNQGKNNALKPDVTFDGGC